MAHGPTGGAVLDSAVTLPAGQNWARKLAVGLRPGLLALVLASQACTRTSNPRPNFGQTASPPRHVAPVLRVGPSPQASASRSLVSRALPPQRDAARSVVFDFFHAVTQRSPIELSATLSDDAVALRPHHDSSSALVTWLRRLTAFDYTGRDWSAGLQIQLFDASTAEQLTDLRQLRLQPASGEWLAVVELPQTRQPQLWGPELQLILVNRNNRWQITKLWEDFGF